MELNYCRNDAVLIGFVQLVIERQTNHAVADTFGYGTIAFLSAEFPSHLGQMQRQIMKYAEDVTLPQVCDDCLELLERWHQHVEHVPGLLAMLGHNRQADSVLGGPFGKILFVILPDATPTGLNLVPMFELREQKGC